MPLTARASAACAAALIAVVGAGWAAVAHRDDGVRRREVVLTASADTYVSQAKADDSYGTARQLRADAPPNEVRSYLRFELPAVHGRLIGARLRLHANTPDPTGLLIAPVAADTWTEETSWRTAPPIREPVARAPAVLADQWAEVDVSVLLTGSGRIDLALVSSGQRMVNYSSREGGERTAPRLTLLIESS
jgi:hypothetical protein